MSDLIARLQSLTEPSREIDAEIYELALAGKLGHQMPILSWNEVEWQPPRYTKSLDVVLPLVPPQMTWNVGKWSSRSGDGPSVYWADLHQDPEEHWAARHPIPAVALLITIIKAKESAPPSEDK